MKLAQFSIKGQRSVAALRGEEIVNLAEVDPEKFQSLAWLLMIGEIGSDEMHEAIEQAPAFDHREEYLLPPIEEPGKILCVGLNYADHARETGTEPPDEPLIFSKLSTALIGSGHPVQLPRVSEEVDYEAELVVVIGAEGRHIAQHEAMEYVAGYTIGCDVSARDWQKGKPGGQWLLGKSFDGFAPVGPWFVPAENIDDPQALDISLWLDGKIRQQSNTREMIFPIDELVSYISQVCTLHVGDLIFTGTPAGVGAGLDPPEYITSGQKVEVEIAGLGKLTTMFE